MSSDPWSRHGIRACALCQSRKVRCDRKNPCTNCIKAGAECVPSQPATARRRRPPHQDLQSRLARCEALLSQYAQAASLPESSAISTESKTPQARGIDDSLEYLVLDDTGNAKFTNSVLWAKVNDELQAMRDIVNSEVPEESYQATTPGSTPGDLPLLSAGGLEESIHDYQPSAAHVFGLWHFFLDRVHPVTKVIHAPSLQPILNEAATNSISIPKNTQALLFGIYLMGAVSMTDRECQDRLGQSKRAVLERYSKAVNIALSRVGVLKRYDTTVLQALVLYNLFLCNQYEQQAAWILNGTIVRIAQKLGMHRDGETLGLPPFETEIRRRIWWHILIQDAYCAMMSGLGPAMNTENSATKPPLSIDDSDMYPEMTAAEMKSRPSEMVFFLFNILLHGLMTKMPRLIDIIGYKNVPEEEATPANKAVVAKWEAFEVASAELLDSYGDQAAGPVHHFTYQARTAFLAQIQRLVEGFTSKYPKPTSADDVNANLLFEVSIFMSERCVDWFRSTLPTGHFTWIARMYLRMEMMIYMAGRLYTRSSDPLAKRAWAALEALYKVNEEMYDFSERRHVALARHVRRAWPAWQAASTEGLTLAAPWPAWIMKLEEQLASTDSNLLMTNINLSALPENFGFGPLTNEPPASGNEWDAEFNGFNMQSIDWDFLGQ